MSKFVKGDLVTQVRPAPVTGRVAGFSLDQTTGEVYVKVEFVTDEGEVTGARDFRESELEAA